MPTAVSRFIRQNREEYQKITRNTSVQAWNFNLNSVYTVYLIQTVISS